MLFCKKTYYNKKIFLQLIGTPVTFNYIKKAAAGIYFSYYNLNDQHLIHDCAIKNAGVGYNTFLV